LLQSSIEYYSHINPLTFDVTVYRGLKSGGAKLLPLYHSRHGEVIVRSSFPSISLKREYVIDHCITDNDGILFEIRLHPGDTAATIWNDAGFATEREILIAASSGFMIESVESTDIPMQIADSVTQLTIPLIKMLY
jgi:hypothetical protein